MAHVEEKSGVPVLIVFRVTIDHEEQCAQVTDRGRVCGLFIGSTIEENLARFFADVEEQGRTIVAVMPSPIRGVSYVVTRLVT